jgi:hypothetical protein
MPVRSSDRERDLVVVVVVVAITIVTLARCVHFEINEQTNVCFYTYIHSSVCVYG